jgi:branched-chain amino acid transport system substrate-binding protein
LAILAVGAAVLVACTGGDSEPSATVATTTTEVTPERIDDGVLTIGALIPSAETGIDTALRASFERAIDAINEAGGVLGNEVEFMIEDEGQSGATASQAIENLVAMDVDAILGPSSSRVALQALDVAVANGIVSCSPTATSIALDEFPDDGLFFRSIATDSLQAIAIASQAKETGAGSVVIFHVDDAYGRPYSDAVADALSDDIAVETIPIAVGDDDLTDELDRLVEIGPQVVVSVGSGEDTASLLQAMGERDDLSVPTIIVNDAARSAASRPVIAGLPSTIRNRVLVVAPQIVLRDEVATADNEPFGPQVTDCVNLLALSALQGNSDSPAVIAGQMSSVSDGGPICRDFATCALRLADGQEIDYDGPTAITDLGRDGDPSRAFFDLFRFESDGSDNFLRSFAEET